MANTAEEFEVDKAEQALRELILSLQLAPAEVVSVADLMKRLGLGRAPVRLALERLSSQGFVVSVPSRGFVVSPLSLSEYSEQIDFAAIVDGAAARLAATLITEEELGQLEGLLAGIADVVRSGDYHRHGELDHMFHVIVVRASGNQCIVKTAGEYWDHLTRYNEASYRRRQRVSVTALASVWEKEIRDVLNALRNRDPDAAERGMRAHWAGSKQRTKEYL